MPSEAPPPASFLPGRQVLQRSTTVGAKQNKRCAKLESSMMSPFVFTLSTCCCLRRDDQRFGQERNAEEERTSREKSSTGKEKYMPSQIPLYRRSGEVYRYLEPGSRQSAVNSNGSQYSQTAYATYTTSTPTKQNKTKQPPLTSPQPTTSTPSTHPPTKS